MSGRTPSPTVPLDCKGRLPDSFSGVYRQEKDELAAQSGREQFSAAAPEHDEKRQEDSNLT